MLRGFERIRLVSSWAKAGSSKPDLSPESVAFPLGKDLFNFFAVSFPRDRADQAFPPSDDHGGHSVDEITLRGQTVLRPDLFQSLPAFEGSRESFHVGARFPGQLGEDIDVADISIFMEESLEEEKVVFFEEFLALLLHALGRLQSREAVGGKLAPLFPEVEASGLLLVAGPRPMLPAVFVERIIEIFCRTEDEALVDDLDCSPVFFFDPLQPDR